MKSQTDFSATIFVVDDDASMCSALGRLLRATGFAVETFASAQQFLDTCGLPRPGLLLLDVMMPEMSGLELQVLLSERGVEVPIIFLTGFPSVSMAVDAMRRGAMDFLEKPFDNAVLVERVCMALQRATHKAAARLHRIEYECRRDSLTPREREVMEHLVVGQRNKAIARALGISCRTVEHHRMRVMHKMRARSPADLVTVALLNGGH